MNRRKLISILGFIVILLSSCQKEPTASFSVSDSNIRTNDTVYFTNTSTDGFSYLWDFGDGSTSNTRNPFHIYSEDNSYNVSLTAMSANENKTDKATQLITVAHQTDLLFHVVYYGTSTLVNNCYVRIYTNKDDYSTGNNRVGIDTTDNSGIARFNGLEPIKYYVSAFRFSDNGSGYWSNTNLAYVTSTLEKNKLNQYILYVAHIYKNKGRNELIIKDISPILPSI